MKPRIALTVGDPAGIGPEIVAAAAAAADVRAACEPVVYGPSPDEARARFTPGRVSAESGRAAFDTLVDAVRAAQRGEVDAIATGPVSTPTCWGTSPAHRRSR